MKDKHDLVRGWLTKAASDLAAADLILESTGPYDTACFHVQQAIEKILKAFLASRQNVIQNLFNNVKNPQKLRC